MRIYVTEIFITSEEKKDRDNETRTPDGAEMTSGTKEPNRESPSQVRLHLNSYLLVSISVPP